MYLLKGYQNTLGEGSLFVLDRTLKSLINQLPSVSYCSTVSFNNQIIRTYLMGKAYLLNFPIISFDNEMIST